MVLQSSAMRSIRSLSNLYARSYATASSVSTPKLRDPSLLKTQAFINNKWTPAASGATFSVDDPATGKKIADVADLSVEDARPAIAAAQAALPTLRRMTGRERANLLYAWHKQIQENAEDLATLITWENGKPLADAQGEVSYSNSFFQWFAEEAPRNYGQTILSSIPGRKIYTTREPIGVAALITPWNFPLAMITRKAGPALAAGCSVVIKSPSETPLTAFAMAELALRAGIPKGVVNVVTSSHQNTAALGNLLTTDPLIKKVSFTGSTAVGKLLMRQSADTLKKLSFELGGNAPFIVFDDAPLDAAVAGAIASKFRSSGQTCVCANRIYVQSGIYDRFAAALAEQVAAFRVGNGFDPRTTHGPLIHARAVDKVAEHVRDATSKGAQIVVGGHALDSNSERNDSTATTISGSNFYAPTVLTNATDAMAIAHEETFGPVGALFRFDSEADAVQAANAADVGLAGYFFSRDVARCWRVADALQVGMVGVNTGLISDAAAPFGGVKESGFGREGSALGLEDYTTVKMVTVGGVEDLQS